jgi:hypothetical protein
MSSFEGYALIIAGFLGGLSLVLYLTKTLNAAGATVLLGVARGFPVAIEHRWLTLLQIYLGMLIAILILEFFLFYAFLGIAGEVDGSVERLGYLAAGGMGFAFVIQLIWGTLNFFRCMSKLRREGRKAK